MRGKIFTVTIKDCKVDVFRAGGKGGQHQNKTSSGVRITHTDSGAIGMCRETRSQLQNKQIAFRRMSETKKFKTWCRIEVSRIEGVFKTIEKEVEESMEEQNLRVEVKNDEGCWVRQS